MAHQLITVRTLALALLAAALLAAPAAAAEAEARVASVRPGKVYLELREPLEVRLGARLVVQPRSGEAEVRSAVLALSSRFLVLEAPGLEGLQVGDVVRLVFDAASTQPGGRAPDPPVEAGARPGKPVLTQEDYAQRPPPAIEPVPFRRRPGAAGAAPPAPRPGRPGARTGATPRPPGDDGEGGDDGDPDGPPPPPAANVVSGEVEVGVDAAVDSAADIRRVTPFGRLALEVDRLGGSDRMRLRFYGSVRQPINGERDWTGRGEDHLITELTLLALEVDAKPEEQVHAFTDRIELRVGRAAVPWVVEAGVIDGAQIGIRFGALTLFGYTGVGASPDPRTSDYDTFVYGGGARIAKTFGHDGALRLSVAMGQQRFRGEGERDFLEAQLDARYARFSLRGSLVVDLFDTLEDDEHVRLTTGILRLGWQVTGALRLEAGYSERRPLYQTQLLRELGPFAALLNDRERRAIDAMGLYRLGLFDLMLRGVMYLGDGARNATGGTLSLGKNDTFGRDRIALDLMVHHRLKGSGATKHSTDPYVNLSYAYYGERVIWQLAVFYRATVPVDEGDRRFGVRASVDIELGRGFGLRNFAEVEVRSAKGERGEAFLLGSALRYRF